MPNCDMCGKEDLLYKAVVEGTQLNVCKNCTRFGKILQAPRLQSKPKKSVKLDLPESKKPEKEAMLRVVLDYHDIIKRKRDALGLKQEEFAKLVNEKASVIHKIEIGKFRPSLKQARRLEKVLKISLVEQVELEEEVAKKEEKKEEFTLGDFIKKKD